MSSALRPAALCTGAFALAMAAVAAPAHAQPAEPTEPTEPTEAPEARPAGEPGSRREEARFTDANADRVVLFSTAETHPKGTFYFSDYELILLQFGYAITDDFELALTGVPPIVKNQPYFFDLAAKLNVHRGDVFRFAVQAAFDGILVPDSNPSSLFGVRPGVVGQFCFDLLCHHSVSLNASTFVNSQSNIVLPLLFSAGLTVRANKLIKILAEPAYPTYAGGGGNLDSPKGFIGSYGIRLSGAHWGLDLTFIKPFYSGADIGLIMGVPWVAFTYRGDWDKRPRPEETAPPPGPRVPATAPTAPAPAPAPVAPQQF
jgi:hypothetical protein